MEARFNGNELRLARNFRKITLEELATAVGKSRQYIHKIEIGQTVPKKELHEKIASFLSVTPSFFTKSELLQVHEDQFHFRKLFTSRATIKQIALSKGEFIRRLVDYLERKIKFPNVNIPNFENILSQNDIERVAENCREKWGIGLGPISNITRLAENIGIIVTSFGDLSKEIDALSISAHRPIIARNEAKESPCRQRFDIAHEIGHFVLHSGIATGDRKTESEANRFAGALLIPRRMMIQHFPKMRGMHINWIGLSEFKMIWKVSKAAILYRANQLNLITDRQYKTGVIALQKRGEAINEKEDRFIELETPELIKKSINILQEKKGINADSIASAMHITTDFLEEIVGFKLQKNTIITRKHLKLIKF